MYKPAKKTKRFRCKRTGISYEKKYLTKKLTDKAIKFYDDCKIELNAQFRNKFPKFYRKVTMSIEFFPKRNYRWDENNFKKAPEDALVKNGIIPDDSIKYLKPLPAIIHKPDAARPSYIKITLEEI
jgi:hypothetical protein